MGSGGACLEHVQGDAQVHRVAQLFSFILLFARKRWGGGAAVLHELLVVVGGRGKRVGRTAEVYWLRGS